VNNPVRLSLWFQKEPHKDSLKIFAGSLFCSTTFVALCVCNFLWTMGVSIIYTYLPDYAISTGLTIEVCPHSDHLPIKHNTSLIFFES